MDKREKTERQRQEDVALHKVLYWMGGATLLVFLLRLTQKFYIDLSGGAILAWNMGRVLPWLCLVAALLTVGAFFWAIRGAKMGKGGIFPWALAVFLLGVTLSVLGVWCFAGAGIQLLTYLVIGTGILAMLYYLYQRDFVAVGLACGLGLVGLWGFFREGATTRLYVVMAGLLIFLAAIALFARYLQKHDGALTVKGKRIELLAKGAAYALIYVTCALIAVVLAMALIFSGALNSMAFYAVPVAWLLIMAVYYTVKLM